MYEIANYDEFYRPYNKSGEELKHADFVKLPANPKGDGLQRLLEYRRGLEIFAIWCLLLEKTTIEKRPENRGKLLNHKGRPASISEIAKAISLKGKKSLVTEALSALVEMGWVIKTGPAEETSGALPPIPTKLNKEKLNKGKYAEFVSLTLEEYQKLVVQFGENKAKEWITELDDAIGSKGYKYKSHYRTILAWARRRAKESQATQPTKKCLRGGCLTKGPAIRGPDNTGQYYYLCPKHSGDSK